MIKDGKLRFSEMELRKFDVYDDSRMTHLLGEHGVVEGRYADGYRLTFASKDGKATVQRSAIDFKWPVGMLEPEPTGRKWQMRSAKPARGIDLNHAQLSEALRTVEFSNAEWAQFGIILHSDDHFIQVGNCYFMPIGAAQKQLKLQRRMSDLTARLRDLRGRG